MYECMIVQWNLSKATTLGPNFLAALDRWSYYAGSTEYKRVSRTTGSGHNREVVALYRWSLGQVPLYLCYVHFTALIILN